MTFLPGISEASVDLTPTGNATTASGAVTLTIMPSANYEILGSPSNTAQVFGIGGPGPWINLFRRVDVPDNLLVEDESKGQVTLQPAEVAAAGRGGKLAGGDVGSQCGFGHGQHVDATLMGQRPTKDFLHRPKVELYDIVADSNELKNRADEPEMKVVREDLLKKLTAWRSKTNDPWRIKDRHE